MNLVTLALMVTLASTDGPPRPATQKLYVANSLGNDIHVIDTATNRVIKRVEVGPQPHGLVATARGDRLFITIENTAGNEGELLWFDSVGDTVTRRMTIGPRPNQLACTPDGKIVYVPCDDATWWVIDTVKGKVLRKIPTGGRPHNTLCSANGKRMYLGPKGSYHVLIADTTTHKLIGEIPLSDAPRPIVLSKDEKRLYANVDTLIGFEVADVGQRRVIHRIEAEVPEELLRKSSRSHGIGLRPDQKELWMCDVYHDRTYVFDITVDPPKQTETIVMKGGGYWMSFSPDGTRCYISERIGDSVAVIDTATKKTVARIKVGTAPKRVLVVTLPSAGDQTPEQSSFTLTVPGLGGHVPLADDAPRPAPVKEPELRRELLERTKTDQDARQASIEWMKTHGPTRAGGAAQSKDEKAEFEKLSARVKAVDADNTRWLRGVIEKHGWPGNTLVGTDGANAAWLLVQHADADPKFQRVCLDLMTQLPKNEVSQSNLAYLTDRVLLAEGKKQRYGTQFTLVDGKWQPRPLEDEANVDRRRTEAGLPPLADYARLIEKMYGSPKK